MYGAFQTPNELTGIVACIAMGAAVWGLRGTFKENGDHPHGWLARAIVIALWVIMLRLIMWDVVISFAIWLHPEWSDSARFWGNWINSVYNLGMVACAYCIQRAILLSIPRAERANWSIWTAWLYPYHIWRNK